MKYFIFVICFIGIIFFSSAIHESQMGITSNILSILFVFGGTLIATLISFPLHKIKRIKDVVLNAFEFQEFDYVQNTRLTMRIAREYKRLGFKSLEDAAKDTHNPYLKLGFQLIADNCDWKQIKSTVEKEMIYDGMENDSTQRILQAMAKYAPAFGLTGTIIGLMRVFPLLSNPENIGSAIALALLTTLYGVLLANIAFLPLANKLKDNSSEDEHIYRFIIEALYCVKEREYSIVIEQKLSALMPKHELTKYRKIEVQQAKTKSPKSEAKYKNKKHPAEIFA